MMLNYQKLDVYQCSIQFVALVAVLIHKLPRGYFFLADELKRASVSMPQNIAEGVGKAGAADRSRYLGTRIGCGMRRNPRCWRVIEIGFFHRSGKRYGPSGTHCFYVIQNDEARVKGMDVVEREHVDENRGRRRARARGRGRFCQISERQLPLATNGEHSEPEG